MVGSANGGRGVNMVIAVYLAVRNGLVQDFHLLDRLQSLVQVIQEKRDAQLPDVGQGAGTVDGGHQAEERFFKCGEEGKMLSKKQNILQLLLPICTLTSYRSSEPARC